ncbi:MULTISPECIES: RNase P modulator RnpM [Ruminococcus]|nr:MULTISPECIES: YlxR family protein [Ruminococcus]MED9892544.1 YlxR family protein [Ruminococcus champanellensis]
MKPKKIPMRLCLGCGEMKPKRELIRVVKAPDGEISLDTTGKKSGRGAYICPDPGCLEKAQKARRLERSFSCRVEGDVYDALQQQLAAATGSGDHLPEGG